MAHGLTRQELPVTKMRRRVGQRVRRMTAAQAKAWLLRYSEYWNVYQSMFNPAVRELTDGLNSQSINAYVVRKVFDRSKAKDDQA